MVTFLLFVCGNHLLFDTDRKKRKLSKVSVFSPICVNKWENLTVAAHILHLHTVTANNVGMIYIILYFKVCWSCCQAGCSASFLMWGMKPKLA